MKQEIGELWIKALRSGEFKQTSSRLRRTDGGFCCLGVLCELYRRETGKGEWVEPIRDYRHDNPMVIPFDVDSENSESEKDFATSGLPGEVMRWSGVQDSLGLVRITEPISLSAMNDAGESFESIADVIQDHMENV